MGFVVFTCRRVNDISKRNVEVDLRCEVVILRFGSPSRSRYKA